MDEFSAGALLAAHLEDAVVFADGLDQLLALVYGKSQGLFEIYVLSGLAGGDGDQGMLVVGGGYNHRVNVRPGKDILIIFINIDPDLLDSFLRVVIGDPADETVPFDVVHVASGHHLHIVHGDEAVQEVHGLLPEAYESEGNLVICGFFRHRGLAGGRDAGKGGGKDESGRSEGRSPEEISSLHGCWLVCGSANIPNYFD